jgi:hypothetical protein
VAAAADRHGVAHGLVCQWLKQLREGRMPGLSLNKSGAAVAFAAVRVASEKSDGRTKFVMTPSLPPPAQLTLEVVEAATAEITAPTTAASAADASDDPLATAGSSATDKNKRRLLPPKLPRRDIVHASADICKSLRRNRAASGGGELIAGHVMAGRAIHADDTPVPVLTPGAGRTKTGRQRVYLHDERPVGAARHQPCSIATRPTARAITPEFNSPTSPASCVPMAAPASASSTRSPVHPSSPLPLACPPGVAEIACCAHVRRGFFDEAKSSGSPIARGALEKDRRAVRHREAHRRCPSRAAVQRPPTLGGAAARRVGDLAHFIRRRLACGSKCGDEAVGLA